MFGLMFVSFYLSNSHNRPEQVHEPEATRAGLSRPGGGLPRRTAFLGRVDYDCFACLS